MKTSHFLFDPEKCVACNACQIACQIENRLQPNQHWRTVLLGPIFNNAHHIGSPLSIACNHCLNAPCMSGCPANAIIRSEATGAVLIDEKKCIGCNYCSWNCPYEAPKLNSFTGIMEKCNFCESRIKRNIPPACVSLCPTGALGYSNCEIDQKTIPMVLEVPINPYPSLKFIHSDLPNGPQVDIGLYENLSEIRVQNSNPLSLKKEWPLMVFTFLISMVVALTAVYLPDVSSKSKDFFLLSTALIASAISIMHLGKKQRAWRAILNIKNSWLSREIFYLSIFLTLIVVNTLIIPIPVIWQIIPGFLLLYSIDRLYRPVQAHWDTKLHSGQTLFISIALLLFFNPLFELFFLISALRFFLYCHAISPMDQKDKTRIILHSIRIISLVLGVVLLFYKYPVYSILPVYLVGEIIDRYDYYTKLELISVAESWNKFSAIPNKS